MSFSSRLILFALAVVILVSGCAKKPGTIKGRVTDSQGNPLGGAAVMTIPQNSAALTDTLGNFIIVEVTPGEYSLMAKFDNDSTVKLIGEIRPGGSVTADIVLFKAPPPPPPPPPSPEPVVVESTKVAETPPPPKEMPPIVDPAIASGARVLHLGTSEFIAKYNVESSDNLVWTLRKEKDSKLKFRGGRMFEGYFSGPYHKYWETAARKLEYDGKLWIYIHGPEKVTDNSRAINISIPLGLPASAQIDSVVIEYGMPRFHKGIEPGGIQLRVLGETASGISILMDWEQVDHNENGFIRKQVIEARGSNKKLERINIETDSDGDAISDALIVRPLIYFELRE